MVRSTFDWSLWIILLFDGLAHPHSWIPYVQKIFESDSKYMLVLSYTVASRYYNCLAAPVTEIMDSL
jgi:hypothetical protein